MDEIVDSSEVFHDFFGKAAFQRRVRPGLAAAVPAPHPFERFSTFKIEMVKLFCNTYGEKYLFYFRPKHIDVSFIFGLLHKIFDPLNNHID